MSKFEFAGGTLTVTPRDGGITVSGTIALRNVSGAVVSLTMIEADASVLIGSVEIGGAGLEVTPDAPMPAGATEEVHIATAVDSAACDPTKSVKVLVVLRARALGADGPEEALFRLRAVTAGGAAESVALVEI